jgi:hypothetical protein
MSSPSSLKPAQPSTSSSSGNPPAMSDGDQVSTLVIAVIGLVFVFAVIFINLAFFVPGQSMGGGRKMMGFFRKFKFF